MKPRERRETGETDLFRSRLNQIINMSHQLVRLAKTVSWEAIETSRRFAGSVDVHCPTDTIVEVSRSA